MDELLAGLGKRVIVLRYDRFKSRWLAVLELAAQPRTAAEAIRKFVKLIEKLPPDARRQWNGASFRSFNIGIQSGAERPALELEIGPDVLGEAAKIDAKIAVTVYPPERLRRVVKTKR